MIIQTKQKQNIYVPVWQLQKENLIGKEIRIARKTDSLGRQVSDKDIRVVEEKQKNPELHR